MNLSHHLLRRRGWLVVAAVAGLSLAGPAPAAVAADPPVITGFAPPGGDPGTPFSVEGTGFAADPAANLVAINGVTATVTAATGTRLDAIVPTGTGPGAITVTTAGGTATSAEHFLVPPSGYAFADISSTGVLVPDGPDLFADISAARKVSVLRFEGTAGQRVSLGFDKSTLTSRFDVKPYGPNGVQLRTPDGFLVQRNLPREGGQFLLPPLPVTGTYALVIDPATDTGTGRVNVTAPGIVDRGAISPTGDPVQLTFTKPWQFNTLTLTAEAGQELVLAPVDWTFSNTSAQAVVTVFGPDGRQLTFTVFDRNSRVLAFTAPLAGEYLVTAVMDSLTAGSQLGSFRLILSENADAGEVVVDGPAKPLTISRIGQHQNLTFVGTAGQRLGFGFTDVQGAALNPAITVITPDGSRRWELNSSRDAEILEPLPVNGVYRLIVNPFTTTGSYNLWVSQDVDGGRLAVDGAPAQVQVTRPGQNVRFTVDGTAGQRLGWGMVKTWSGGMIATVLRPDGRQLLSQGVANTVDVPALPDTGTYQFIADLGVVTGAATFHLTSDVEAGAVAVGGDPVTLTVRRPGQNVRATFDGTAGSRLDIGFSDVTLNGQYRLRVLRPDGREVAGPFPDVFSGRDDKDVLLPVTGRYEIELDPVDDNVNTGDVRVTLSTAVAAGQLTPGGPGVRVELPRLGQDGIVTFDGTSGQQLALTFAGRTFVNGGTTNYYRVTVLGPNGAALSGLDNKLKTDDTDLAIPALTASGTYQVIIDPDRAGTGGITVGLRLS